jgi:hypothetical protein
MCWSPAAWRWLRASELLDNPEVGRLFLGG